MYRQPLRSHSVHADKKVLLIDRCQATREARAAILRSHNVEVHEAEEIRAARFLWQPNIYGLVMLDFRRYSSYEMLDFYDEVKARSPRRCFVFMLGPPLYLSRTWPGEVTVDSVLREQWGETVRRFMVAA
jgi:response regulator RpfG family c-di-GMP phosphodiesterase